MIIELGEAHAIEGRHDVCIAGAGVAGIVLARRLAQSGQRVLLLEGGGLDFEEKSQALYAGENVGRAYFDLDTARLRFLGGTSNHWNGWCRPLDPYDFAQHDHVAGSGWPLVRSDLDPYLDSARDILELAPFPDDQQLHSASTDIKEIFFNSSNSRNRSPVRIKEKYSDFLNVNQNVTLVLHANLTDIQIDTETGRVRNIVARDYATDARPYEAVAEAYVLALGGIENPRILLNANKQIERGLGNETDLVGRFFMEHPHHEIGYYVADPNRTNFGRRIRFIAVTQEFMNNEKIANANVRMEAMTVKPETSLLGRTKLMAKEMICQSDVIADFIRTYRRLQCPSPDVPWDAGVIRAVIEQVPNPSSRVQLSADRDRFGLRRVRLDWQLTRMEKRTLRSLGMAVGRYFAGQNLGRVKLKDWLLTTDEYIPGLDQAEETAGYHHIGTTRMGANRRDGVVDRDCRMFDVQNLYIAGSSVFRTAGHANPTLSIVQLTLRLAEHLSASP